MEPVLEARPYILAIEFWMGERKLTIYESIYHQPYHRHLEARRDYSHSTFQLFIPFLSRYNSINLFKRPNDPRSSRFDRPGPRRS